MGSCLLFIPFLHEFYDLYIPTLVTIFDLSFCVANAYNIQWAVGYLMPLQKLHVHRSYDIIIFIHHC